MVFNFRIINLIIKKYKKLKIENHKIGLPLKLIIIHLLLNLMMKKLDNVYYIF